MRTRDAGRWRRGLSWFDRDRVRALLAVGGVLGLGAVGTMALWTDSATATATFTTGSVQLRLTSSNTQAYSFTTLGLTNMAPGNNSAATVLVKNTGTLPFTYKVTGAAVDGTTPAGLAAALQVTVTAATSVTGTGTAATCGGTALAGANAAAVTAVDTTTARALAAATSETLCFQVTLPSAAASGLQSATTAATFTFTATNS